MFESPVRTKSKLTHPCNDVSFTLAKGHQMARLVSLSCIGLKSQIFSTTLSFSVLAGGDPIRISVKALRILKLESSRQLMVKIW